MLLRKEFCKGGGGKRKGAPNDEKRAREEVKSKRGVCAKGGRHGVYYVAQQHHRSR